jgi:CHAT domain-containing protein/tetratricopeptide (TPR) repeat protein
MPDRAARYSPLPEVCLAISLLITFSSAGASVLAAPAEQAPGAGDIPRLTAGVITRDIIGGQQQRHVIGLTEGQFLRVVVEPTAIDVKILLIGPDEKPILTISFARSRVPESLSIEARATGDHALSVEALSDPAFKGSYSVRVETRTPTPQDHTRIAVERQMRDADALLAEGTKAQEALALYEKALGTWRDLADRYEEAQTLYLIGRVHTRISRPANAIEWYERALVIFRDLGNLTAQNIVLNNMGIAYNNLSRSENAIEVLQQAVEIAKVLDDPIDQALPLNNLGIAYNAVSQPEKSIEVLEQALAINRQVKSRSREASSLNGLANAHRALNRYEKALEYYLQAAAIHRETKNRLDEALTLGNVAIAYHQMNRLDKAVEYYKQALALHREVKNRSGEGIVLNNLGIAYNDMGRPETAIEYLQQGLAIAREVKRRVGEANSLVNLGNAYRALAQYDKALEHYEQALPIQREVRNRAGEGSLLNQLGGVAHQAGQVDKAIEYSEQALAIAREVKERSQEAGALRQLALVERDRGNLSRARTLLEETLAIFEALRSDIYNPESRTTYFAAVQEDQAIYGDLLMRLHAASPDAGYAALALEASERARARGLLELLTEAGAGIRSGVDLSLLARERALAKELNAQAAAQVQLLRGTHPPEQGAALKLKIGALESEYEDVQTQIRRTSPRYASITQPQALTLAEIQRQVLDPDTLLLEYALGAERSFLWAVSATAISTYELPKRETIDAAARQVLDLLTVRGTSKPGEGAGARARRIADADARLPEAARHLSEIVLRPVIPLLPGKRLLVVPDGVLQYVPFVMLPLPVGGKSGSTLVPLIVDHEIITLPSASTLAVMRRELASRKPAEFGVAVVADPVFSATDRRVAVPEAPGPQGTPVHPAAADNSRLLVHLAGNPSDTASSATPHSIPRLPFSRQEADRILAVAADATTFKATDFMASKATVTSAALGKYRYVHFATHGYLDSERPGFSALVLSMVDERGAPQDGFLRANEVYNLSLPAELVVLSACQTGLGKDIRGEGLVGLTRGFMYAGAARVVVSLWSVSDRATSELMARFYDKMLRGGQRPAAALRAAQVELWRQKAWQAPYYWAAFTLQGEWK